MKRLLALLLAVLVLLSMPVTLVRADGEEPPATETPAPDPTEPPAPDPTEPPAPDPTERPRLIPRQRPHPLPRRRRRRRPRSPTTSPSGPNPWNAGSGSARTSP